MIILHKDVHVYAISLIFLRSPIEKPKVHILQWEKLWFCLSIKHSFSTFWASHFTPSNTPQFVSIEKPVYVTCR